MNKTGKIRRENNNNSSRGPDRLCFVDLYKDGKLFGTIDSSEKSYIYSEDIVENWESGILKEDNEHIVLSEAA
jgi:hypothetical protein